MKQYISKRAPIFGIILILSGFCILVPVIFSHSTIEEPLQTILTVLGTVLILVGVYLPMLPCFDDWRK